MSDKDTAASYDNINNNIINKSAAVFAAKNSGKYKWLYDHPRMRERCCELITLLRRAIYPGLFGERKYAIEELEEVSRESLSRAYVLLHELLCDLIPAAEEEKIKEIAQKYFESLPGISDSLDTDIRAAYEGDPAAVNETEIMLAYPAFEAISIYRLAHRLYELSVPLLPRMMTEYAHSKTGIDIHPGAKIGDYFFIDHGTGVVIGETCTIGEHVKLYQGVTLGAKSFELDENGNPVKGVKRHPDIGNHVIIYANATILGGRTSVGDHSIIGGNVWLTRSVGAGEKIFYNNQN